MVKGGNKLKIILNLNNYSKTVWVQGGFVGKGPDESNMCMPFSWWDYDLSGAVVGVVGGNVRLSMCLSGYS